MSEIFIRYITSQIAQARKYGLIILLKKLWIVAQILLAIPVILLVRIIRPFILFRFGQLISTRIGHFAINTELYLCERDMGMDNTKARDFFCNSGTVCNQQLYKMWKRVLSIHDFIRQVDRVNRFLPGGRAHCIPLYIEKCRDIYNIFEKTDMHLRFTREEEETGFQELLKMGVPKEKPFACLHARDTAYLDRMHSTDNPRHHHGHSYRNSSIDNYTPAAEELAHRGYFTMRMGTITEGKLDTTNAKVIDYAAKYRTDFLDIFLSAKCDFFISSTAGIGAVPNIFRRPMVCVNTIPLEYAITWGTNNLFIPKKLWLKGEKRFLTFSEIYNSEVGRYLLSEQYDKAGIKVVENTAEEIKDIVIEMDERLKGIWQSSDEDSELRRRFNSLLKPSDINRAYASQIGSKFLRENIELLEGCQRVLK